MQSQSTPERGIASNNLKDFAETLNPSWQLSDWFKWPPDLFALSSLFLKSTGSYRYAVSPPIPTWPLEDDWSDQVDRAAALWQWWILGWLKDEDLSPLLRRNWEILDRHWQDVSLDRLVTLGGECEEWSLCRAMLELHSIADRACGGFGHPSGDLYTLPEIARSELSALHYLANTLLATTGSLSRLPKNKLLVLPKMRTPRVGITLRSLSHYVTVHESEVGVVWRSMPWINSDENTVNILVVPWPYEMHATWFRPSGDQTNGHRRRSAFFKYTGCEEDLPVYSIVKMVKNALKQVNRVHMIVFPELALKKSELEALQKCLAKEIPLDGMPMVITGLRNDPCEPGNDSQGERQFDRNQVVLSTFFAGRWYNLIQDKHHRWKLDEQQIQQYNLSGILMGKQEWWEAIEIPPRKITFLAPNGWLALCPLICEDLARLEPVSDLIRGVGPTLLIAILLDGPQLRERWPGRYASVLADDPGTSVLTVSSLGMAERSLPSDRTVKVNRTVALWKDAIKGWDGIELKEGEQAVLMTVAAAWTEEQTADGRGDGENAGLFVLRGLQRVKAGTPDILPSGDSEAPHDEVLFGKALDIEELTRFTFLVDAAIDSSEYMLDNLRCWALGKRFEGKDWLKDGFKAGASVWSLIYESIRESYEERNQESDAYDPAAARRNFGVFVDWLVHTLKATKDGESEPFKYWERLVDRVRDIFEEIRDGSYAVGEELRKIIAAHGGLTDDERRVRLYSGLSILWAIHNRIAHVRRREKRLTPEQSQLLQLIERLLKVDYRSVLRKRADDTGASEATA